MRIAAPESGHSSTLFNHLIGEHEQLPPRVLAWDVTRPPGDERRDEWYFPALPRMLFRPLRPSGNEAEQSIKKSERHAVTVLLTKEHLRKMIDDHLLKEDEVYDQVKVARVMQKLLDSALGFPEKPWHDWDEWVKGLE